MAGAETDLLPEQVDLLRTLVEAARSVSRFEQQFQLWSFDTDQSMGTIDYMQGAGMDEPLRVLGDDIWALHSRGYLDGQFNVDGSARFTVTAEGFALYESLQSHSADAAEAVEEQVRRYLDGKQFRTRYPDAYERLAAAETMLWQSDPESDLTTVGHKLREAIQQFATVLVTKHAPSTVDPDPAKTKNRLRAVLEMHRTRLGDRKADLLTALIDFQDGLNGVVQRLEHGDQKPGDSVTWEDARSAVFQTANFMFEFDRLVEG